MRAPTGDQYTLTRETPNGRAEAVITELAASLRTLRIGGVNLTHPYPESVPTPAGSGIVLVPWPNRVEGGVWELDGKTLQLDLTEPSRSNAIHGLLRNTAYRLVDRDEGSVTLGTTIFPQHGYPFLLETTVRYELTDDGIAVTHRIRNDSAAAAPVAIGAHPYFAIGDTPTADLTVTVRAASRFVVSERLIPTGEVPVDGTEQDLRAGARVGDLDIDQAYSDLAPVDGSSASLTAPDGRTVSLWQDESFPYLQVFVTHVYPEAGEKVLAVAMEPMTAPANALASGRSLRWVEPGETFSATWGIRATL